jgi:hypothetical protein
MYEASAQADFHTEPKPFFNFQITSGKIKRCKEASVARSKADEKLLSGKPRARV